MRLEKRGAEGIDNLGGWLTRVVGRICLDVLRRRTTPGETALDTWAIDAVITDDALTPEDAAVQSESLGLAMMIVLDSLRPEERFAFVLHDLFAVPFAEIAAIIECLQRSSAGILEGSRLDASASTASQESSYRRQTVSRWA